MEIKLNKILPIEESEYNNWSICLNNAPAEGIYSFDENHNRMLEHISWKKGADKNTSFRKIETQYCLQFIRLDKDLKLDNWLFLGAFENFGVIKHPDGHETYDLKPIDRFIEFRDKLIIYYKKKQGPKQAKIDINLIKNLDVVKILEKPYIKTDLKFDGYNNVTLPFYQLKRIVDANVDNWRELLSNINCVYVITDLSNGKLYIGSTYGFNGVWQRWSTYGNTKGSGHNKELDELIQKDPEYAYKNFQFTILESFFNVDGNKNYILEREKYWTRVFQTIPFGYNTHY